MGKALPILILLTLVLPQILLAQIIVIENPLAAESFEELVDNIITFIFNIAVALAPVMIIISGFLFVTAAGDPERVRRAKDILLWTLIGFTIVLLSKGFITLIRQFLGA